MRKWTGKWTAKSKLKFPFEVHAMVFPQKNIGRHCQLRDSQFSKSCQIRLGDSVARKETTKPISNVLSKDKSHTRKFPSKKYLWLTTGVGDDNLVMITMVM